MLLFNNAEYDSFSIRYVVKTREYIMSAFCN